ncbi:MAG: hypothetical protein ACFHVJ_10010 [Aestuariibacter sp.]
MLCRIYKHIGVLLISGLVPLSFAGESESHHTMDVKPLNSQQSELEEVVQLKSIATETQFINEVRALSSEVIYRHKSGIEKYNVSRSGESGRDEDADISVRLNAFQKVHSGIKVQDVSLEHLKIIEVTYQDGLNIEDTLLKQVLLRGGPYGRDRATLFFDESTATLIFEKNARRYVLEVDLAENRGRVAVKKLLIVGNPVVLE